MSEIRQHSVLSTAVVEERGVIQEFRQNWPLLLGATAAVGTGASMFTYTANFLVVPLQQAQGWTRGEVALGATIFMIVNALAMPAVGVLTSRIGSRRVAVPCAAAFGAIACILSALPITLATYYAMIASLALFGAGTNGVVYGPLVTAQFRRVRGLALSTMLSGSALLLIPLSPVFISFVAEYGWRAGYLALSAAALLVGLPAALLATRQQLPQNFAAPTVRGNGIGREMRTSAYWKTILGVLLSAVPLGGFVNQISPILASQGLSGTEVAGLVSLFLAMVLLGRICVGALLDLFNAPVVSMMVMLAAGASLALLLLNSSSYGSHIFVVIALGAAMGAEGDIQAYLLAKYFDLRAFAPLFGTAAMCTTLGFGLGAFLFGTIFDHYGNYTPAIITSLLTLVGAGLSFGALAFERNPNPALVPCP